MKTTPRLRTALRNAPLIGFSGILYRVVDAGILYGFTKHAGYVPVPLYDLGPPARGARFSPKGGAPALYLAGDIATAHHERFGIVEPQLLRPTPPHSALVTYRVEVKLHHVLDLTDPATQALLDTTSDELASAWRYRRDRKVPPTQRLGRAAATAGHIEALRFRSTKGPGHCYAIFTRALKHPSVVEVDDPDGRLSQRLP